MIQLRTLAGTCRGGEDIFSDGLMKIWFRFLKEIKPGTWIPLRVLVLRDILVTDRK